MYRSDIQGGSEVSLKWWTWFVVFLLVLGAYLYVTVIAR